MCYKCTLLGLLIHSPPFDPACLREYDANGMPGGLPGDPLARAYLRTRLARLAEAGVPCRAIHVQGDGNCLYHAVSRSLVGYEFYYFALRLAVEAELAEHKEWYARACFFGDEDMVEEALQQAGQARRTSLRNTS